MSRPVKTPATTSTKAAAAGPSTISSSSCAEPATASTSTGTGTVSSTHRSMPSPAQIVQLSTSTVNPGQFQLNLPASVTLPPIRDAALAHVATHGAVGGQAGHDEHEIMAAAGRAAVSSYISNLYDIIFDGWERVCFDRLYRFVLGSGMAGDLFMRCGLRLYNAQGGVQGLNPKRRKRGFFAYIGALERYSRDTIGTAVGAYVGYELRQALDIMFGRAVFTNIQAVFENITRNKNGALPSNLTVSPAPVLLPLDPGMRRAAEKALGIAP